MSVLDRIVDSTREEVRRRRERTPLSELEARVRSRALDDRPFSEALTRPGVSVIAEHKRRSPSAGEIRAGATVPEIVVAYERGGAAALSILTEGPHFAGTLDDLRAAQGASSLPILRKDFIVDTYQVYESAAIGADALLLIVAALDDRALATLLGLTHELGMQALVEVHDEAELDRALAVGATVVGVNNRDLRTFVTTLETTERIAARLPASDRPLLVSESGISSAADVARVRAWGADAVLVGEALVTAPDIAAKVRELAGTTTENL
jgi:indole-3-glycerol phosphate synthase